MIDRLRDHPGYQIHSQCPVCFLGYFYFDFKDTAKKGPVALLSSLLVQLSNKNQISSVTLLSLCTLHTKNGRKQPTDDSLARSLKDILSITGQVLIYLIIDALDECPNDSGIPSSREKVLELVKELVELHHSNLRVCVTSRPEFDIRTKLETLATQQLSLHNENGQKQDILDYVTSVVHSDKKMKRRGYEHGHRETNEQIRRKPERTCHARCQVTENDSGVCACAQRSGILTRRLSVISFVAIWRKGSF
jgi:hypothetical protein